MSGRALAVIAAVVAILGGLALTRLDSVIDAIQSSHPTPSRPQPSGHPYGVVGSIADPGDLDHQGETLELDPPPPEIRFHPTEVRRFDTIKKLYQQGQYQKALDTIYAQLADSHSTKPYKAIITKKIPIVTSAIAIQLANQGHCSRAIEIFQNAINRDPDQLEAHRGLLLCFLQLKQIDEGIRHVDAFKLLSRPGYSLTEGISLLFEQAGRNGDAMVLVKKLIRHLLSQKTPDYSHIQKLRARLNLLQSRLNEDQLQVSERNAHFRMTFREGVHEEISRWLLESAEGVLDELNRDYSLPYPRKPIETVLYPKTEFNKLVGGGPEWAKGVFDGKIRLPIADGDNDHLLAIFRHELAHALLWEAFRGRTIPGWFNEGLAQLMECPKGCKVNFRRYAARQGFLPIKDFLVQFVHLPASKARMVYIQSLFMVTTLSADSLGFGSSAYPLIIQHIMDLPRQAAAGNDAAMSELLLRPVDLSFEQLHRLAARRWAQLAQ